MRESAFTTAKEVFSYTPTVQISEWLDKECRDVTERKYNAYREMIQRRKVD